GAQRGSSLGWRCTHHLKSSDEYDVVLVNAVESLDLQADRPAHLSFQFSQGGGFFIEEAVHDVLMGQNQQLATRRLPALSHNLTKNLVAHGLRSADEAAPLAAWTGPAQQVFQALARALAGHLHEAERREADDVCLGTVAGECALECREHRTAVRLIAHVDEVDDDDAAEVTQPQLPRNAHRRLEGGAEYALLEVAVTDVGAGVHIDGGHRLGLVDHQVPAGFQWHLAVERLDDLLLDAVQIEDRSRAGIQLDAGRTLRHEGGREF